MTEPMWNGAPVAEWRFSKFYLHALFDGHPHLVRRDVDFPGIFADEDIIKKLRSAAYWRKTTLKVTRCPEGLWVQSPVDLLGMDGTPELRQQLAEALMENVRLKEELCKLTNNT